MMTSFTQDRRRRKWSLISWWVGNHIALYGSTLSPNGEGAQELVLTGIPLGIYGDQTWGQAEVQLEPGDLLVLYTDGITEARNGQGALFGEERLLESVNAQLDSAGSRRPSAQEIQDAILAHVHRFAGDVPQSDDIALAVLGRDSDGAR